MNNKQITKGDMICIYAYVLYIAGTIVYESVMINGEKAVVIRASNAVKNKCKLVKMRIKLEIHDVKRKKEVKKLEKMWNA